MKKYYLSFLTFCFCVVQFNAQNTIDISFDHSLGGDNFGLFQETTSPDGYVFDLDRLEYYISDMTITHDGGQVTEIEDVWLLVQPNEESVYSIGEWMIDEVEGLDFFIGVGPDVNHEDPTLWPSGHPLAPQNPSMHWGWSSGYRFVAMEGNAGPSSAANTFQIHALGDGNYNQVSLVVNSVSGSEGLTIYVDADYTNALDGIDVSSGAIVHSIAGDAIPFLANFSNDVFTPGAPNSVNELDKNINLTVAPNPSNGNAQLIVDLTGNEDVSYSIIDISGKTLMQAQIQGASIIDLPNYRSGIYIIDLFASGQHVKNVKWVVE